MRAGVLLTPAIIEDRRRGQGVGLNGLMSVALLIATACADGEPLFASRSSSDCGRSPSQG